MGASSTTSKASWWTGRPQAPHRRHGFERLGEQGGLLTAVGRLTGLYGALALVVQLVLVAVVLVAQVGGECVRGAGFAVYQVGGLRTNRSVTHTTFNATNAHNH